MIIEVVKKISAEGVVGNEEDMVVEQWYVTDSGRYVCKDDVMKLVSIHAEKGLIFPCELSSGATLTPVDLKITIEEM